MAGDRSPNYPIISLADAVSRIQLIYEKERTHAADKEVIAKSLGFGSLNGASRGILSALRKFGLLTEEGDQVRVSNEALDILLHSPGRPERVSALQKGAFLPPLFSDLRAAFGRSLPSDENMRAFLIKKGFNPNTVTNVIRSYRDTVEFVEFEARSLETATQEAEAAIDGIEDLPQASAAQAPRGQARVGPITMMPSEPAPGDTELAFKLSERCHVRLHFTGHVTQEAIAKLEAFLDLGMDVFPAGPTSADVGLEAMRG